MSKFKIGDLVRLIPDYMEENEIWRVHSVRSYAYSCSFYTLTRHNPTKRSDERVTCVDGDLESISDMEQILIETEDKTSDKPLLDQLVEWFS